MASKIELELFEKHGTHGVKSITFSEKEIKLVIAPWEDLNNELVAKFEDVILCSIEAEHDEPDELELPWDIIAIDCDEFANGIWKFCIRCTHTEFVFKASWPTKERNIILKRDAASGAAKLRR